MSQTEPTSTSATAFCVTCGRSIAGGEIFNLRGTTYCENCLSDAVSHRGPSSRKASIGGGSPGAAFALGLIPGVGAIYNAEFVKAAIHILIFGFLISLADAVGGPGEALFGLMTFGFYAYMPFEAYYTAKKRKLQAEGIVLETPIDGLHEQLNRIENKELWVGVGLIGLGALFLLDNMDVLRFDAIGRLWPLALIAIGVWLIRGFKGRAA